MPYFDHKNILLHYEEHGERQPVLMLHGAAVNFQFNYGACGWTKTLTSRGAKVIGPDLRGHGKSSKLYESNRYGSSNMADDALALLDHLNIEKACIIGYSLGSVIALHLIKTMPSRFSKAALIATGDGLINIPPYTFDIFKPGLIKALSSKEFPDDLPRHISAYRNFVKNTGGDMEAVLSCAKADYPAADPKELSLIETPVLVISGSDDIILGQGQKLAESFPNGKYMEIEKASHFDLAFFDEVKDKTAEFLLN